MKKRESAVCACSCLFAAILFLGMAIAISVLIELRFFKKTLDNYVRKEATLKPGHEIYKQWVDPTIPMYKDFYIFNLTNPTEFARGAKPRFDELGPYRYREFRKRTVLDARDGTITYVMDRTFHFDTYTGNYSESDMITTINFAYVAAIYNANSSKLQRDLQLFIDTYVRPIPQLVITTTVHELLWNYTDPLLKELNKKKLLPSPYIYIQLNDSYADRMFPSIIHSGTDNSEETARFIQYAGMRELPFWRNEANFINNSTEGLLFHPFLHKNEVLQVFISDANRTFPLQYQEGVSVRGIDAYRFRLLDSVFRPDPNYLTGNNTPVGLIYIGILQNPQVPVYASKPHFLDCDKSLLEAVEGISPPDRSKHDIIGDVEPITGCTLNAHLQTQLLVNVSQTSRYFEPFNRVIPLYFPIFYVDEHATMDEELKSLLTKLVIAPLTAINSAIWVALGLCCFIALLTGLCTLRWCIKLYQFRDRTGERIHLLLQKTES